MNAILPVRGGVRGGIAPRGRPLFALRPDSGLLPVGTEFTRVGEAWSNALVSTDTISEFAEDVPVIANGRLEIAGQSTSIAPYSSTPYTNWTLNSATRTLDDTEYFGRFTDSAVVASAGAAWNRIHVSVIGGVTSGTTYAGTDLYKVGTSGLARFVASVGGNDSAIAGTPGSLSAVATLAGTMTVVNDTALGGGFYQLDWTWTPNATGASTVGLGPNSATIGENITVISQWMKAAASAWPYIETGATAVTRYEDRITVPTSATAQWGVIRLRRESAVPSGAFPRPMEFNSGDTEDRITIYISPGSQKFNFAAFDGNVQQAIADSLVGITPGAWHVLGWAFDVATNRLKIREASGSWQSDQDGTFVQPNVLGVGCIPTASGSALGGSISDFEVYSGYADNSIIDAAMARLAA